MIRPWDDIDPKTAEAQSRGIIRRLADLEDALKQGQIALQMRPDSYGLQLSARSLLEIQGRLKQELASLARHRQAELVTIVLRGQKFQEHSSNAGVLGALLIRLQKLYTSVGQSIRSGPTLRGPFAKDLVEKTDLRLAATFESSFGMTLYANSDYDLIGDSLAAETLQTTFQLLSSAHDEDRLMRLSGEVGRRAITHLRHVAIILRDSDAEVDVRWTDMAGIEHEWRSNRLRNDEIIASIQNTHQVRSEQRIVEGRLVGASLLRNRFELLTADGVIEGKYVGGISQEIRRCFGLICRASLDETVVSDLTSGEEKIYYALKSVELPN